MLMMAGPTVRMALMSLIMVIGTMISNGIMDIGGTMTGISNGTMIMGSTILFGIMIMISKTTWNGGHGTSMSIIGITSIGSGIMIGIGNTTLTMISLGNGITTGMVTMTILLGIMTG